MPSNEINRGDTVGQWGWAWVDGLAWVVCVLVATWLRFDFQVPWTVTAPMSALALSAAAIQILVGVHTGPYTFGRARGSFEEVADVALTVAITTAVIFLGLVVLHPAEFSRAIPLVAGTLALSLMLAQRFVLRAWRQRRAGSRRDGRRVIVFGAGEGGHLLVRAMQRDADSPYTPVAVLDDDPRKSHVRLGGLRVQGGREEIGRLAKRHGATVLAIALPSADAAMVRDLSARANEADLDVLILPPVSELFSTRHMADNLRDLDVGDLLGRRPVALDTTAIAEQLSGRRVLVTGAGGSIGSELCRQIARFGPARLFLLDRDESGLQATQLTLTGNGLLDNDDVQLVSIRDLDTLRAVFNATRPDIVFHAAALKHLPLLEAFPLEAWKSNVLGTRNVLMAAAESGVGTFVNISTDKAANPACVLGYSKRLAERLTADFAAREPGRYVSVRFGNVLGSRGSVVHAFTAQILQGGPVTVTHPDVERFFMLIPEACQLVLEAASMGEDGEVLVLDMGEQVKIVDVAKTLIQMSGRQDIDITYTGLRPGEKMSEELFSPFEQGRSTSHDLVSRVDVPPLEAASLDSVAPMSNQSALRWMRAEALAVAAPEPALRAG